MKRHNLISPPTQTSRPRVIHVTTSHLADDVRIFEKECRALVESGRFEVFLAAAGRVSSTSGVHHVPLPDVPGSRLRRFYFGPRRVRALIRSIDVDLWHFHDPELLPTAYRLARSGKSVIWDAHEDYVAQLLETGAKSWVPTPFRSIVRFGTRQLLKKVDTNAAGIVAATPRIAELYSNPNTTLVGNEAILETFAECCPMANSRTVLFTGNPSDAHLFLDVVRAVHLNPDINLQVAGRAPDPTTWSHAESILGDRLRHLGWLDRAGLTNAIGSSSIGLSTYADVPTNSENSPNKLFEFAAAGLPVVATPNESNRRHLGKSKAGLVAKGFGHEQIAEAIEKLHNDNEFWDRCSAAGRVWAREYGDWKKSGSRLIGLYDDLLEKQRNT